MQHGNKTALRPSKTRRPRIYHISQELPFTLTDAGHAAGAPNLCENELVVIGGDGDHSSSYSYSFLPSLPALNTYAFVVCRGGGWERSGELRRFPRAAFFERECGNGTAVGGGGIKVYERPRWAKKTGNTTTFDRAATK